MKFALVNQEKVEAAKGLVGICPNCGSELIAKCGEIKINHWAHKRSRNCDPWWENETEWHRAWKSNFPPKWQEIIKTDELSGEKHIADVCTSHGLVVEFQHSYIKPEERRSREAFYKNMVWVVNGTRLKRDFPRFLKEKESFFEIQKGIYQVNFPEECFPVSWLNSSVPVIFDFLGNNTIIRGKEDIKNNLYCIFPVELGSRVVIAEISRRAFITKVVEGKWIERSNEFIDKLIQTKKLLQEQKEKKERKQANLVFNRLTKKRLYRKGRRF